MVKKAEQATPNRLLRAARKERGWTQKGVADRIGAPQAFNVSRWENGTAFPSAHYVEQLCDLFGRSARELGLIQIEIDTKSESALSPATLNQSATSPPLWTVPYRRNPFFTGREEVLGHLHDTLTATKAAALNQIQAISGLGGIGKTQIAVEYAHRYSNEYHFVLWIRAANRDTLLSDFVTLAALLDLPGQGMQDQQLIVNAVKRWLESHQQWLLILDNADDLDLATEFLPTGNTGQILLTTRAQATGSIAPSIAVEKMDMDEGTLLLLRRAKLLAPDAPLDLVGREGWTQAVAMVKAMDGLPLALDQAGAYIEETGCGLSGYLELYHIHRKELMQRRSMLPSDHPEPVAATWALSFLKVEQANPAAADLLRLCAFLDPDAIPEEMLTPGAPDLGPVPGPATVDPFHLNAAIETLRKFSLVKRDPEAKLLTIHRLVQAVLIDVMDKQTQRQWAELAVRTVNRTFPEVTFKNWNCCQQYLPHAQACAGLIDQHCFIFPEAARMLEQAGWYLYERALYKQAEPILQRALAIYEQAQGPEHPSTAVTLNRLANLYLNQGRHEQAELFFQRALTIREHALGADHPDTAGTLNDLAWLYHYRGRYSEAEPLYRRALTIYEQVQGPDHPNTAITLNHLGTLNQNCGRYAQAELFSQRALTIREHALGPEHPDTAISLNNLAFLYRSQGRYSEAEPLYRRALTISEQVQGPEHPLTATFLDNLAVLYVDQGRYAQAEPLHQRALAVNERAMGLEHLDTAISLDKVATLYHSQGRYSEAEPLFQRALTIYEQILGSKHPRIAITFDHLATLYFSQGQHGQAEILYQHALAILEQAQGLEHPNTARVLDHLAVLYGRQSKYEQAEALHQRALAIRKQVLGSGHPDTAESFHNLATLYNAQGRYEESASLIVRALAVREERLGPEHPDTARTLGSLALLSSAQGRYEQARPLYQRVITTLEKVLGAEHPDTGVAMANYADLLQKMKQVAEGA